MKKLAKKILVLCLIAVMTTGLAGAALAAEDVAVKNSTGHLYTIPGVIAKETVAVDRSSIDNSMENYIEWVFISAVDGQMELYTVPVGTTIDISGLDSYGVADIHLRDGVLKYIDNSGFGLAAALDIKSEPSVNGFTKGSRVTFLKEGYYAFEAYPGGTWLGGDRLLRVVKEEAAPGKPAEKPAAQAAAQDKGITATPTNSKVLVNGTAIEFDAYTINGNNYFKLRDVAQVVSGSAKQFDVTWDGGKNAINLISGQAYATAGGALEKGDGTAKKAEANTSAIYKDGAAVTLAAYTINGNNFFKLRDLGEAFGFDVAWDSANNAITIDTAAGQAE